MCKKFILLIQTGQNDNCQFEIASLLEKNQVLHGIITKNKDQITEYYKNKTWDKFKKLSNEYELIFTTPGTSSNISKYSPVSRSFFKLWEILYDFKDEIFLANNEPMKCMFLAEGPGGFSEAFLKYRRDKNIKTDKCYGMTLKSNNNKNIPEWKNNEYISPQNIQITYGEDNTGDLYNLQNIFHTIKLLGASSVDFITADGGFDFSADFNNQEESSVRLILSELLAIICLQKQGGKCVLKIYDMFSEATLKIINFIKKFYKNVYIIKPNSSRPCNSEKYLLCVDFKNNEIYRNLLIHLIKDYSQENLGLFLSKIDYDAYILQNLVLYNTYYSFRQVFYIERTINYINRFKNYYNEDVKTILNKHRKKSIKYCKKYDLPINY